MNGVKTMDLLTVYYGEDTFYIKNKIKQHISALGLDEFNVAHYDLEEQRLDDALADAATIPFMSEHKMVILHHAYFLSPQKSTLDQNLEGLKRYLAQVPTHTYLVFTVPGQTLDNRLEIVKTLKKQATLIEAKKQTAEDLGAWMKRQFAKQGLSIDHDAYLELIKRVGKDTEVAYLEIRKLLAYAQDLSHISLATIQHVITRNIEDDVFEILNAMLRGDKKKALHVYHDLVAYSEDPLRVLSLIVSKYREINTTQRLIQAGASQEQVQHHFNVKSGRAYFMVQNAREVPGHRVREHLKQLETLDHQIKTGYIDKKLAVEMFILST